MKPGDRLLAGARRARLSLHDVGSPLNTIVLRASLLAADEALDASTRSSAQAIREQCGRIAETLLELHRFAREAEEIGHALREQGEASASR